MKTEVEKGEKNGMQECYSNAFGEVRQMRFNILSDKRFLIIVAFSLLMVSTAFMVPSGLANTEELIPDWFGVSTSPYPLSGSGVTNPVLTASQVSDVSASFVADPFLFYEGGTWFMFFEVQTQTGNNDIGLATSSNGLNWTYRQIVLSDGLHHSFPYVFKWNGTYYMVPESYTTNSVRLYKATNFPYGWTYMNTLVTGRAFADNCIIQYNGVWWLFTGDANSHYLWLYYSNSLTSSWVEHPLSPIVNNDASKARPAGRNIVYNNGVILRFAQKCDVSYGQAVRAFQVDTLTKTSYAEHEIPQSPLVQASGSGWNKDGMHNVDPWWIGNRWLAAVDGVNYSPSEVWAIGIYVSPIVEYQLTTSTNYGTVSPPSGMYDAGSTVTITATPPAAGPGERYVFLGWTGSGAGSYTGLDNPASVTMNAAITETASWARQYYLTVSSLYGTTSGQDWYDSGATAYAGLSTGTVSGGTISQYVFSGWSGDASGTNYAQSDGITMNAPKTAMANWKTQYLVSFAVSPSGAGTTSPSGASLWEDAGTLSISATADPGYTFSSWSSSTESITFANANLASTTATISGAGTITATLTQNTYNITAFAGANGSISPNGSVTVNYGDSQTFTITPDGGCHIADVLVDESSVGAIASYTLANVTASHNITASFAINTYTITFTQNGLPSGTAWSVRFNDVTQSSTTTTITFTGITSGSYSWGASTPISGGTGTRYVASTSSGTMDVPTQPFQAITYTTQFYLTVASAYGTASGSDWYNSGATAYATVTPSIVNGSTGTRYVFKGWSGDASGTMSSSGPITMNAPKTATANYLVQYYMQVTSTHGSPTASNWVNAGDNFEISVESPTEIVPQSHRWVCTGFSLDDGTYQSGTAITLDHVSAPHSVTFAWKEQFWVAFEKNGLPDDASVNVVVNSVNHTLPFSEWFDQGVNVTFAYQSNLPNGFGSECILSSLSAESPIKVDASTRITGQYSSQFTARIYIVTIIPTILVLLIATPLLTRRRRKKQNK